MGTQFKEEHEHPRSINFTVSLHFVANTDNRANKCNPNQTSTGPGKVHQSFVDGWPHRNPFQFYNRNNSGVGELDVFITLVTIDCLALISVQRLRTEAISIAVLSMQAKCLSIAMFLISVVVNCNAYGLPT
jgi:hypothetical protein